VDVLIAADDAAAVESGESQKTDDAHTTTSQSVHRQASRPSSGSLRRVLSFNRCDAILQLASQSPIDRMAVSLGDHARPVWPLLNELRRVSAPKCEDVPRNVTFVDP
jgi:hypothetical protein